MDRSPQWWFYAACEDACLPPRPFSLHLFSSRTHCFYLFLSLPDSPFPLFSLRYRSIVSLSFSPSISLPPSLPSPRFPTYVRITARKVRGTLNIQQFAVIINNFTDDARRTTNLKLKLFHAKFVIAITRLSDVIMQFRPL